MGKSFRKIDTQLFLALTQTPLTMAASKVLNVVIHYTLGYNQKTQADISLTTFQELTSLSRPAVKKALKLLSSKNIVHKIAEHDNRHCALYQLNIDFATWNGGKLNLPSGGIAKLPSRGKPKLPSNDAESYPQGATMLPSRGKLVTSETPLLKKERKLLKKGTTTTQHPKETTPESSFREELHPSLAGKNGKNRVLNYLQFNGVCSLEMLATALGMRYGTVQVYLNALKKDGMVDNPQRGKWRVSHV
jgi:DNA-binding transcriptional ArsR family regulator